MRIEKCWFCSSSIYPGHGVVFVRNDAKTFRFCRSKCHRHFKAKHNPRKMKWTKAYRKVSGKEMVVDSTFAFEKRRHCPVRYDRDMVVKTIQAMKVVDNIKENRKLRYYKDRMAKAHLRQTTFAKREIEKHSTLLNGPEIPQQVKNESEQMTDVVGSSSTNLIEKLNKKEKTKHRMQDIQMNIVEQHHCPLPVKTSIS